MIYRIIIHRNIKHIKHIKHIKTIKTIKIDLNRFHKLVYSKMKDTDFCKKCRYYLYLEEAEESDEITCFIGNIDIY